MYNFKYGLSCALEPQPERQPVILRGEIEQIAADASKAGYDAIELFIRNAKQYNPSRLLKAAQAEGLSYCAIATGMEYNINRLCLISDDKANRTQAIDALKAHLDLGAEIGCPVIVGIMRGNISDFSRYEEYEGRFSQALAELSAYAQQTGGSIVVESIMRYINNYLNSAPETAEYLRKLELPNVKLHIDTHSMIIEDKNLPQSVHETADIIGYVHFSDSNRCYPGAGNIDFKSILKALMDVEYQGYISMECQPYPTEYECAERGLKYTKQLVEILEIERQAHQRA